jgi:dienelactone hydrolase
MEIIKNQMLLGADDKPMLFDLHFLKNNTKKPVVIYVHGFNGFKGWGNFDLIANYFAAQGYFFVKMNLSHNGTSLERPEDFADLKAYSENNYTKELEDVKKIVDWVCETSPLFTNELNQHQIALLGHSRGGGIAILKANEDPRIKALITWASVLECKTPWGSWPEEKIKQWREDGVVYIENKRTKQQMPLLFQLFENFQNNQGRLNIEHAIKSLRIPIQICHGTEDEAVPYFVIEKFKEWKSTADFVSVNSDHVFGRKHPYAENFIPEKCMEVITQNISFLKNIAW